MRKVTPKIEKPNEKKVPLYYDKHIFFTTFNTGKFFPTRVVARTNRIALEPGAHTIPLLRSVLADLLEML